MNDTPTPTDAVILCDSLVSLCVKWEDIARQHAEHAKECELKDDPSFLSEAHWHKSNTLKLCADQLRDAAQANAQPADRCLSVNAKEHPTT